MTMATTLAGLHWGRGTDGELVAEAHDYELAVYPPTKTPATDAFWFVVRTADDGAVASGWAPTTAEAKEDAVYALRQDLRLWDL